MQCPDCGYILRAFETGCPRCRAGLRLDHAPSEQAEQTPEVITEPVVTQRVLVADASSALNITHKATHRNELYLCRRCGAANPPHGQACEACGETIGYDRFFDALRDPGVKRASVESIGVIIVLLVCLHIFDHLPDLVQGCVVLATVIVLAWRFLQAFEGRKG